VDGELSTNKKGNVFAPEDELVIFVTNKSGKDLYIELVGANAGGQKVIPPLETNVVKAGRSTGSRRPGDCGFSRSQARNRSHCLPAIPPSRRANCCGAKG
jgi:hypothetical protein